MSEQQQRPEPDLDLEYWAKIEAHQVGAASDLIIFDSEEPRKWIRGQPVNLRQ